MTLPKRALLKSVQLAFFSILFIVGESSAQEQCIFRDQNGSYRQVIGRENVPEQSRASAQCSIGRQYLAAPKEIVLEGNSRNEYLNTPLGKVTLRWPRKIESIFGRTPLRATTDAASTVSRTLKRAAFPSKLQNLDLDWQVVFMDADLPETQIPSYLIQNCHPGWMTPPANIYIVAQRVAGVCRVGERPSRVADESLTRVLVHEMGHAVEYYMLEGSGAGDRMRAEGFATWFEQYAADASSVLNKRAITRELKDKARAANIPSSSQFFFSGSGMDYARAAAYFSAMEERLGARAIADLYSAIARDNRPFFSAIQETTGWGQQRLDEEVQRYLK